MPDIALKCPELLTRKGGSAKAGARDRSVSCALAVGPVGVYEERLVPPVTKRAVRGGSDCTGIRLPSSRRQTLNEWRRAKWPSTRAHYKDVCRLREDRWSGNRVIQNGSGKSHEPGCSGYRSIWEHNGKYDRNDTWNERSSDRALSRVNALIGGVPMGSRAPVPPLLIPRAWKREQERIGRSSHLFAEGPNLDFSWAYSLSAGSRSCRFLSWA